MIADFQCKECGNSETDVLIKTSDEIVLCKICEKPMQRIFSGTIYKSTGYKGTPYPTHLLGGGERAKLIRPE